MLPSLYLISREKKDKNSLSTKYLINFDYSRMSNKNRKMSVNLINGENNITMSQLFVKKSFFHYDLQFQATIWSWYIVAVQYWFNEGSLFATSITMINYEVSKYIIRTLYCLVRTTVKYWLYLGDCVVMKCHRVISRAGGTLGAGWAFAPSDFGRSVTPLPGANHAHHKTIIPPPGYLDLPLWSDTSY